tara:strand:+ start:3324 stop:4085 length:762 start_codon:yes stop_codon:yes gene_type:complete
MIKIFRKIRQNLLMENKTRKYFKYAIGEIVLVVIGILIALQINNWNERRKIQSNQEKYLTLLKIEAENNLKEIRNTKNEVSEMNMKQIVLYNLINIKQDTVTEKQLSESLFRIVSGFNNFKYENSVLSDLKSSGNLKNVLNDSLRKYLIALEPLVIEVQNQEDAVVDSRDKVRNYINENGSLKVIIDQSEEEERLGLPKLSKSKKTNIDLLGQVEFENILILYIGVTNRIISTQYPEMENHLIKIIDIIDKEL